MPSRKPGLLRPVWMVLRRIRKGSVFIPGPVVWGPVSFRVRLVKARMANGLPGGKGRPRDGCPWWGFLLHSQTWRTGVIPGKESGTLFTQRT